MRLVARGDMDGLTCAVLITEMEKIDSVELIHPQQITDDEFEVTDQDILTNVPFHPKCSMWFDHHQPAVGNRMAPKDFRGKYQIAPSAARLVYDYYDSPDLKRFEKLVDETDRMDAAKLKVEDVLDPKEYILMGFTIDSRTGLGDFKTYFMQLVDWLKEYPIEQLLLIPEVKKRIEKMATERKNFSEVMKKRSWVEGNVIITDLREEDPVPVGNRFLIYTLFPEANVSVRLHWGPMKEYVMAVIGHSIFNRTCPTDVGKVVSRLGGGGHTGAGSAPVAPETIDIELKIIVDLLQNPPAEMKISEDKH